jgi:hypothetical protein
MPFLFMFGEMEHEICPRVLSLVLVVPRGDSMVVDAGLLECFQGQFDSGSISDGAASGGRNTADAADTFP